jgi:hypothetical protein
MTWPLTPKLLAADEASGEPNEEGSSAQWGTHGWIRAGRVSMQTEKSAPRVAPNDLSAPAPPKSVWVSLS